MDATLVYSAMHMGRGHHLARTCTQSPCYLGHTQKLRHVGLQRAAALHLCTGAVHMGRCHYLACTCKHSPCYLGQARMCVLSLGMLDCAAPQRLQRSGTLSSASAAPRSTATRPCACRSARTALSGSRKAVVKLFQCCLVFSRSESKSCAARARWAPACPVRARARRACDERPASSAGPSATGPRHAKHRCAHHSSRKPKV